MSNRRPARVTARQFRSLVTTANGHLNTLGVFADEHLRHLANRDEDAIRRSKYAVIAQHRLSCAAVAEVSRWADLDDAEQAAAIADLREALHADECALGMGSAAVREVA